MRIARMYLAIRMHLSPCTPRKQVIQEFCKYPASEQQRILTMTCPSEEQLQRPLKNTICQDMDCRKCWDLEEIDWKTEKLEVY